MNGQQFVLWRRASRAEGRRPRMALLACLLVGLLVPLPPPTVARAATVCVNTDGSGGCFTTIQAAVNAAGNGDTITVAANTASKPSYNEHVSVSAKSLTIQGAGANATFVDGTNSGTVFALSRNSLANVAITLSGLTIRNGQATNGGGIAVSGLVDVTLADCVVTGNTATSQGGGIYSSSGRVRLVNTRVDVNHAPNGGGIFNDVNGAMTITGGEVNSNQATAGNGGGLYNNGGNDPSATTLTLIGAPVRQNQATNSTYPYGQDGQGGGIFNGQGTVNVTDSTVSSNASNNSGGGIANYGGTLAVTNSTLSSNRAVGGGGIYNNGGTANLTGTTLSGNTVSGPFTGITSTGTLTATNSTLSDNGYSLYLSYAPHTTLVQTTVTGTIRSDSSLLTLAASLIAGDFFTPTTIQSQGYNLIRSTESGVTGLGPTDLRDVDPKLDTTLKNNGGPTQTVALLPGSPAINYVPLANCIPATDQRHVPRPIGPACDIGAFEMKNATTAGVFRPSNGQIYLRNANSTGYADSAFVYGVAGDQPVAGNFTGRQGLDTVGVYRGGTWYLRTTPCTTAPCTADTQFQFGGASGDLAVVGDWDGNGSKTVGIYRNGTFLLRNSNSTGAPDLIIGPFGVPGDIPIAGDWTGKGYDSIGVYRPSNGLIYLKNTNTSGYADSQIVYGQNGDKPVVGDWNNDDVTTFGVARGNAGDNSNLILLRNENTTGPSDIPGFFLGVNGDIPIAGDWDGLAGPAGKPAATKP